MITKYMLRCRVGGATLYYKNGEGRGWKTNKTEATMYSDSDFACRDRTNAFTSDKRQGIDVIVVNVPEPSDDFMYLRELASRIMQGQATSLLDCDRLLQIAQTMQEAEENDDTPNLNGRL